MFKSLFYAVTILLTLFVTPAVSIDQYASDTTHPLTQLRKLSTVVEDTSPVLIVYDSQEGDSFGYLSELYAVYATNLVSHFHKADAIPLVDYQNMNGYDYVVYVGYSYTLTPKLTTFIRDVLDNMNDKPIMWLGNNIWELVTPTTEDQFGFRYVQQRAGVDQIYYKGEWIARDVINDAVSEVEIFNYHRANKLAYYYLDNAQHPWAVQSNRKFMYIGDIPFSYVNYDDRYVVFADLLFEFFNVHTIRNRALVRLEDIGPHYDVSQFLGSVNYLKSENVPFSFGIFPIYVSRTHTIALRDSPDMINAIKHAINSGGTMIYHGLTHQYNNVTNPYNGQSGAYFEFYLAHVDPTTQGVIYDGPVPDDSRPWVQDRLQEGFDEFQHVGISLPTVFEFPHYMGSDLDYRVVSEMFPYRYDMGAYFIGSLNNSPTIDHTKYVGQFYPFTVTDIYNSKIIPENLGNYINSAINNNANRYADDMIRTARLNKNVVRDSIASFFYHPYLGVQHLQEIVSGIKDLGYTFVSVDDIANDFN